MRTFHVYLVGESEPIEVKSATGPERDNGVLRFGLFGDIAEFEIATLRGWHCVDVIDPFRLSIGYACTFGGKLWLLVDQNEDGSPVFRALEAAE